VIIEAWRRHYNEVRPHSSLSYLTPNEFVAREARPAPRQATGRELRYMGPPRPGPLRNRPLGDKCSQRGKPSQPSRGPKNQGRSTLPDCRIALIVKSRLMPSSSSYNQMKRSGAPE
jgi:hypothetical protein